MVPRALSMAKRRAALWRRGSHSSRELLEIVLLPREWSVWRRLPLMDWGRGGGRVHRLQVNAGMHFSLSLPPSPLPPPSSLPPHLPPPPPSPLPPHLPPPLTRGESSATRHTLFCTAAGSRTSPPAHTVSHTLQLSEVGWSSRRPGRQERRRGEAWMLWRRSHPPLELV